MGKVADADGKSKRYRTAAELHAAMLAWAREELPAVTGEWLEAVAQPINLRPRYKLELEVTTRLVAALKEYVELPLPKGPRQAADALLASLAPSYEREDGTRVYSNAHLDWLKSLTDGAKRGPQGWSARTALAHALRLEGIRDLDKLTAASLLAGLCTPDDDRLQSLINEARRGTRALPTAAEGVDVERRRMREAVARLD